MWRVNGSRQAVDLGHHSAPGLVFAYFGGESELLSGSPLLTKTTSTGRAGIIASRNYPGQTAFSTNTTSSFASGGFNPDVVGPHGTGRTMRQLLQTIGTQHTIFWSGSMRTKTNNSVLFGVPFIDVAGGTTKTGAATFDAYTLSINMGASATWRQTMGYRTVGNVATSNYAQAAYDPWNTKRSVAWFRNAAAGGVLSNGKVDYSASYWQSPALDWNSGAFAYPTLHGIDYNSTSYGTVDGVTDVLLIWNRSLSAAELMDLEVYPHQLLQQVRTLIGLNGKTDQAVSPSSLVVPVTLTQPSTALTGSFEVQPSSLVVPVTLTQPSTSLTGNIVTSVSSLTVPVTLNAPNVTTSCAPQVPPLQMRVDLNGLTAEASTTSTVTDFTVGVTLEAVTIGLSGIHVYPDPFTVPVTLTQPGVATSAGLTVFPDSFTVPVTLTAPDVVTTTVVSVPSMSVPVSLPSRTIAIGVQVISATAAGTATATAVPSVIRRAYVTASGTSYAQARTLARLAATRRTSRRPRRRF